MTIIIEDEFGVSFDFNYEEVARSVIETTLDTEHFPYDAEVSITFVDEEAIRDINRDYRDIDNKTDVLSFPLIEYEGFNREDPTRTEEMYNFIEEDVSLINPDNDEVMLGDIVLCIPVIYIQAEEYNHSVLREYAFLIAHSMLHLLGYDHMEEGERVVMEDKQRSIMDTLNILRD